MVEKQSKIGYGSKVLARVSIYMKKLRKLHHFSQRRLLGKEGWLDFTIFLV